MSTLPFAFTKPDEPSPIVIAPVNVSILSLLPLGVTLDLKNPVLSKVTVKFLICNLPSFITDLLDVLV